jgi:hypothetical protein
MDLQTLQQQIKDSSWEDWQKETILGYLPNFGEHTFGFISKQITGEDFTDNKEELFVLIEGLSFFAGLIKDGSFGYPTQLLSSSYNSPSYKYGAALVPVILDLDNNFSEAPDDFVKEVLKLKVAFIGDLPKTSLGNLIARQLLVLLSSTDFVHKFKELYYYSNAGYVRTTWTQDFVTAILSNQEQIGKQQINSGGKTQEPTIKNWLNDFIAFNSSGANSSSYNLVKYIEQSASARALSKIEQQQLLEVLKFYTWLLNPIVLEQEIEGASGSSNSVDYKIPAKPAIVSIPVPQTDGVSLVKKAVAPVANLVEQKPSSVQPESQSPQQKILTDIKKAKVNPDAASRVEALLKKNIASAPHAQEPKLEIVPQEIAPVSIDEKLEELKKRMNR